jgi:hypothetical protein
MQNSEGEKALSTNSAEQNPDGEQKTACQEEVRNQEQDEQMQDAEPEGSVDGSNAATESDDEQEGEDDEVIAAP